MRNSAISFIAGIDGVSHMSEISRDPLDLVAQTCGTHHQYPDGFMLFLGTLVFSVGYLLLYPGLGNFKGLLPGYEDGWTQVNQWQREMDRADELYGPIFAKYAAMPIEEVVKGIPVLPMTTAPFLRLRSANGISAVITMSPSPARSAIQLSAASKLSLTTTSSMRGSRGTFSQELLTTWTFSP